MNKIKVCFISLWAYPLFNKACKTTHGGAEIQLFFLANKLKKDKRFEISFIVGDFKQDNLEILDEIKLYKSYKPDIKNNLLTKFYRAVVYYRLFKKINADIYFISASDGSIGVFSFLCKLFKKKFIFRTASQMDVDNSFITNNGISGKLYKYGLENANAVITQSKDHQKLLKKNHNLPATIIRNSFIINEKNKPKKDGSILWVSRFIPLKRPELFLKLAKIFPDKKFIMISPQSEENNKEYELFIKESKKIRNFTFIRKVEFDKIQEYFDKAELFINTSEIEGFPNTFIQAGIGRTPILSLNVNPDNFLNKYNCGYPCDNNLEILVKRLKFLLTDKKEYKLMQKNLFRYIHKNYDINKNLKKFKKILFSLIHEKN